MKKKKIKLISATAMQLPHQYYVVTFMDKVAFIKAIKSSEATPPVTTHKYRVNHNRRLRRLLIKTEHAAKLAGLSEKNILKAIMDTTYRFITEVTKLGAEAVIEVHGSKKKRFYVSPVLPSVSTKTVVTL